jgi:Tfp pilus assembly protein PilF
VHDSIAFLVLTAVAFALFGVTWFLFQSFNSHRAELATQWANRGRAELRQGQAGKAVESLRAALSYAPDDYNSQLLLAQALADSGEIDQATNYYLNLWSARPGDGYINLQLARMARRKGTVPEAVRSYRASIFGDWRGDATFKRRDVRVELADYLIEQKEDAAARVELLIAAGNAPNNLHLDGVFADKLLAAGDSTDALTYYQKAIADNPHNASALAGAGRILFDQGDYEKAHGLLRRAAEDAPERADIAVLAKNAQRLIELSLARTLPAHERAEHLVADAKIAQARLASCAAGSGADNASSGTLFPELQARWTVVGKNAKLNALVENAAGQDTLTQLIFDTERETTPCGAPTGDDALLLKLAQTNAGTQ